jgi:alkanesulfonate monooxygenase SsuD/methylene tetrahydromethanopterin reductase-like flavin-dependent oxidoreductase (luciferase family)
LPVAILRFGGHDSVAANLEGRRSTCGVGRWCRQALASSSGAQEDPNGQHRCRSAQPLAAWHGAPGLSSLGPGGREGGLDSIWAEDHLAYGDAVVLRPMCVLLAAAAGATEHIEVGSAVFVPSLRNLAWALKQVATLQFVARGRLRLGVGLGGASEEEYELAGLTRSGQRQRTEQFLGILAAARRGEVEKVAAPLSARALLLGAALPVPPLWVGGTSLAALRRAARFGDGWLSGLQTPAEFQASLTRLRQLAGAEGRPCQWPG